MRAAISLLLSLSPRCHDNSATFYTLLLQILLLLLPQINIEAGSCAGSQVTGHGREVTG